MHCFPYLCVHINVLREKHQHKHISSENSKANKLTSWIGLQKPYTNEKGEKKYDTERDKKSGVSEMREISMYVRTKENSLCLVQYVCVCVFSLRRNPMVKTEQSENIESLLLSRIQ